MRLNIDPVWNSSILYNTELSIAFELKMRQGVRSTIFRTAQNVFYDSVIVCNSFKFTLYVWWLFLPPNDHMHGTLRPTITFHRIKTILTANNCYGQIKCSDITIVCHYNYCVYLLKRLSTIHTIYIMLIIW